MRATKRDIAIILFRFLSIYSFVKATEFLSDKFIYFFNPQNFNFGVFIQIISPSALLLICGIIIWYLSPMMASWISTGLVQDEKYGFSLDDVQDIAFSAIGLCIVVNTIPDIVNDIGFYCIILFGSNADKHLVYARATVRVGSLVIKLVLSMWLLIGSHGIAKIVRAMRRD